MLVLTAIYRASQVVLVAKNPPANADEPAAFTEWSKKEKDQYCILTHIWNLERQYRQSYMQGSKGDTDVKNRLLDSVGEGEGGMIWENSLETCILPYVKKMASASLMHETGHPKTVLWDNPEG